MACRLYSEMHADIEKKFGKDNTLVKSVGVCCTFAEKHRSVIERFGRFPHRNEVLKREPTSEEQQAAKDGTLISFF